MPVINRIAEFEDDMRVWRRHLHTIPELDFELPETAAYVAQRLREIGVDEIHEGIARSGIVALVHGSAPGPAIGLRADMDALPIEEVAGRPHGSQRPGRMHACGHDGHTAILLGAGRYLAETRNFAGTVALIFQPAEETSGGGRVMCDEGIMERFGITRVYGLHNAPGAPFGSIGTRAGPLLAAVDDFEITVHGRGGHAARPDVCIDPVAAAIQIAQGLYAIPARTVDPLSPVVVSLTMLRAGTANNVVPDTASLQGTVRTIDPDRRREIAEAIARLAEATAAAHGARAEVDYRVGYPVLANDPDEAARCVAVAAEVVGAERVVADQRPELGAEDFAYMLKACPGAYVLLGTGEGAGLHRPEYDYNDAASPIGASYFVRLAETALPLTYQS